TDGVRHPRRGIKLKTKRREPGAEPRLRPLPRGRDGTAEPPPFPPHPLDPSRAAGYVRVQHRAERGHARRGNVAEAECRPPHRIMSWRPVGEPVYRGRRVHGRDQMRASTPEQTLVADRVLRMPEREARQK